MESRILLLILLTQLSMVQCRYDQIKIDSGPSGTCKFTGYIPGGNTVTVKRITAPMAKLEGNIMSTVMSAGGKASTAAMHSMNALKAFGMLSKSFAAIAPALGPCLGVFGVVLGGIADLTKPKPADIIKATNKAIAKLTEEVNNRLDEMKGYVDMKVIDLEKTLITKEYKSLFNFWANCIKERTYDLVNECQRDAVKQIIADKPKFLVAANKDDVFSVKRLEASLITLRDYVVLSVMSLKGLIDTYQPKSVSDEEHKFYYDRYTLELKDEVRSLVSYVENPVETIIAMHRGDGTGSCFSTYKCNGMHQIKEGGWFKVHTGDWTTCTCVMDPADVSTKTCGFHLTIRMDGKYPGKPYYSIKSPASSTEGACKHYGKYLLTPSAQRFANANIKAIKTYWSNELLDLIPSWKGVANITFESNDDIAEMDEANFARNNDDLEYSPNYRLRLAVATGELNDYDNNYNNDYGNNRYDISKVDNDDFQRKYERYHDFDSY